MSGETLYPTLTSQKLPNPGTVAEDRMIDAYARPNAVIREARRPWLMTTPRMSMMPGPGEMTPKN